MPAPIPSTKPGNRMRVKRRVSTRSRSRTGMTTVGRSPASLASRKRNGRPSTVNRVITTKADRIEPGEALDDRVARAAASGIPPPSRSPMSTASHASDWLTAKRETRSVSRLIWASSGPLSTARTERARAKVPAASTATSRPPAIDRTSDPITARLPLPRRKRR